MKKQMVLRHSQYDPYGNIRRVLLLGVYQNPRGCEEMKQTTRRCFKAQLRKGNKSDEKYGFNKKGELNALLFSYEVFLFYKTALAIQG